MRIYEVISLIKPNSSAAEAYRILNTNVQLIASNKSMKIIMVTSAGHEEGRSITASNLAVNLAQSGKKTILLDCDQRNPDLHNLFGSINETGLTNILEGNLDFDEKEYATIIENLYIVFSGTKLPNNSELIGSPKLEKFLQILKKKFNYVIIDTPPVTAAPDALIISQYTDGCIYVVSYGKVDRSIVLHGKELLVESGANIIGVVFNRSSSITKKVVKRKRLRVKKKN